MNKETILQQLKEYSQRRKVQPVLKEQIDRLKKRAVLRKSEGAMESERQAQERMRSIKRLEEAYRFNRRRQKSMDICLNTLEYREKTVLWYFYIDRPSDYIDPGYRAQPDIPCKGQGAEKPGQSIFRSFTVKIKRRRVTSA